MAASTALPPIGGFASLRRSFGVGLVVLDRSGCRPPSIRVGFEPNTICFMRLFTRWQPALGRLTPPTDRVISASPRAVNGRPHQLEKTIPTTHFSFQSRLIEL